MQTRNLKSAVLGAAAGAAMLAAGVAQAAAVPGQGTWETTLLPRDLDGNAVNGPEAFYDTALDITWLRNANVNGLGGWAGANIWANTLVVNGVGGWRLPTMVDTGALGCDFSYNGTDCGYNVQSATSEMAHLFYVSLGNKGFYDTSGNEQPGWGLTNTGGFQNMQSGNYWSGLELPLHPDFAWYFSTYNGRQDTFIEVFGFHAPAVRPGDVAAAIPEPQTYALVLMGLGALALALKRRPR